MSDDEPPVRHDPETEGYVTTIDPADTEPTYAVVLLLQACENAEEIELPPLYEVINCDALNQLLVGYTRCAPTQHVRLEYTTTAFELTVECQDGTAEMRLCPDAEPTTDDTDPSR